MTPNDFRKLALKLPETREASHMGHPDFRVAGKIFATLGYPRVGWGVVRLTPQQQGAFVRNEPDVYAPVKGLWGERGATTVNLKAAHGTSARRALHAAWCHTAPRTLVRAVESGRAISAAPTRTRRPPSPRSRTPRTR
jgi:hypothetical protein